MTEAKPDKFLDNLCQPETVHGHSIFFYKLYCEAHNSLLP